MNNVSNTLDRCLARLGPDIHRQVSDHIVSQFRSAGPAQVMEIHIRDGRLIFDPLARNGFVLRLDANTSDGNLDAGFSPDGELIRGLIGDHLVMDVDRIMSIWQTACGRGAAAK